MGWSLLDSSRRGLWQRNFPSHGQAAKRLLPDRMGELLLLFLFLVILAGRYNLSRISSEALGLDLRFAYVWVAAVFTMLWWVGARKYLLNSVPIVGLLPFYLWASWMILTASWAPEGARTGAGTVDLVFLCLLVTFSWFVMSYLPAESLDRLWNWLLTVGIIYFLIAIAAGPGAQGRYSAPGGGPNTFVRIMVAAAIAALYLAIVERQTIILWLLPVFAVGAALSGSRGGLVSAGLVVLMFLVPLTRLLGIKKFLLIIVFLVVGAWLAASWRDGYLLSFVQERFIEQTLIEGYSSGRDDIVAQTWEMFLSNPVTGVGLDGFFALQTGHSGTFQHPHNLVLGTLAEGGLIGGVFLAVALIGPVNRSFAKPFPVAALFAAMVGIFFFGAAMFSGDYYDSRFVWFFLGLAAIRSNREKDVLMPAGRRTLQG